MKTWKAVLVELLNIAGTGPIFGALMGACFGPIVFLWIVAGSILGGAVHDYMCGMISGRHSGESIAELSGIYLGRPIKFIMRVFTIVLLMLVGTVFVTSPASLLAQLTLGPDSKPAWVGIILAYFLLATLLLLIYALALSKWKRKDPEEKAQWSQVELRGKRHRQQ